jgi:alpha-L-fucosidase
MYQPWNSVNLGPKKDLFGGWAEAVRKNGMKFGVSVPQKKQES